MVWRSRVWLPASRAFTTPGGDLRWFHQFGLPIFPATEPWHDEDLNVDAFWGPSVHWNTHLQQYVMLLNKAKNEDFRAGRHLHLVRAEPGRSAALVAARQSC
jgi:hypothetical protein